MICSNTANKECDVSNFNITTNIVENTVLPIVPNIVVWWFRYIILGILCQSMALFGVITNVINIVVFIKLGVKDPMNVSLLGLSISDFISCFTVIWTNIALFPPFTELQLPFNQGKIHYLFGSWPHSTMVRVTTCITAFITIERCLCVTFPLKVREMITTKRVAVITVFFFVLNFGLVAPIFFVNHYEWVFFPQRNRTIYTLVFSKDRDQVEPFVLFFLGVIFPILAFILTIVSTFVMVFNLKKNAKWRQQATGKSTSSSETSSSGNQMSARDAKVAKMVVMISTLYLVSFSPVLLSTFVMTIDPEVKEGGIRENLLTSMFSIDFLLETANAALNIFIYYFMSSNYKAMFASICCLIKSKQKV